MIKNKTTLDIKTYPSEVQSIGEFDGGRITEIKPISFPGGGATVPNTGPLFYWAWATANGYGKIELHPHQAFEIMSYALEGEIGHYDTLGNRSKVKAGGAQVMQTGSGVSHEEETLGDGAEFFQIWFEPDLSDALKHPPTYREFPPEEFPTKSMDGVMIKSIIGESGPIDIKAEAVMKEVRISPGHQFTWNLKEGYSLAIVTIDGDGVIFEDAIEDVSAIKKKDFSLAHAKVDSGVSFKADIGGTLKLAIIQIPAKVDYPLYRDRWHPAQR